DDRYYNWLNNVKISSGNTCRKRNTQKLFIDKVQEAERNHYNKKFYSDFGFDNFDNLLKELKTVYSIKEFTEKYGVGDHRLQCHLNRNGYNIQSYKDYYELNLFNDKAFPYYHCVYNKHNKKNNHKVKSVSFSHYEDVYNITVEKYHNFAIVAENENSGIFVKNSLGGGKTFEASLIFMYQLYFLSCWNFPQLLFGLARSTVISFCYLCPTIDLAERNGYGFMRYILDTSPYFKIYLPRNTRKNSRIEFLNTDKLVILTGSEIVHFQGSALYGMIFDEANFVRGGGDIGKLQKAIDVYREATNRRKSRFIHEGKEYGASIICSSADTETSFTEQEMKNNEFNELALIKVVKKYDLQPQDYSTERFFVFKGDKNSEPFVINRDSRIRYKALLEYLNAPDIQSYLSYDDYKDVKVPEIFKNTLFVNPPINFYQTYLLDVYGSLKEVDGIAIQNSAKFFTETTKLYECYKNELKHPFTRLEFEVSTGVDRNELIDNFIKGDSEEEIARKLKLNLIPDYGVRGKDGVNYYGRIDLSKTADSVGIAIGHEERGKAVMDMEVICHPPNYPEKIDFVKILDFIMWLKNERNYKFKKFSFDQYQSEFFIQYFTKKRIDSFLLSVDRTDEQYKFLKNKIIMNEVQFYKYDRFEFELLNLIHDFSSRKVDHPDKKNKLPKEGGYGKDVCDAVCGVVWMIFMTEVVKNTETQKSIMEIFKEAKYEMNKNSPESIIKREEKILGSKLFKPGSQTSKVEDRRYGDKK
ncbi:MAG: hypothetical protein ABSG25_11850, partial [Bryobacteraceae bacterium]